MRTDVITVSAKGKRMETALDQVEKVAAYKGLSPKNTLHLRLLTEEMMGLMRSITGEPEGEFWIEDHDGEYELHLRVAARMSFEKREQLLSVSASGKNEAARGLMGRIREFFDWGCDEDYDGFSTSMLPDAFEHSSSPTLDWEWSMRRYENVVAAKMGQDEAAREAWDELEKSVVKNVADDVRVFIRNGNVEMTILKKIVEKPNTPVRRRTMRICPPAAGPGPESWRTMLSAKDGTGTMAGNPRPRGIIRR